MSKHNTPGRSWELVQTENTALRNQSPVPPPPVPYPGDDEEATGFDVRRYVAAVLRHKWLILALAVVGTAGGVVAARYLPEEYQAQATVWVEASVRNTDRSGPISTSQLLPSNAWIELLRSFYVLDHVVLEQRLYLQHLPQDSAVFADFTLKDRFRPGQYELQVLDNGRSYVLRTAEGVEVERGQAGETIGSDLGFDWQPSPRALSRTRAYAFTVAGPREVAVELNRALQTRIDQSGNFLRIELRRPRAEEAARILNAIADRYTEVAAELKRSRLEERTVMLEEQLRQAEENLQNSERRLESFKVATAVLPTERASPVAPGLSMTQNPVFDSYFNMKVTLEQLRQDREALERALRMAQESELSPLAFESIQPVRESSELTAALGQLTQLRAERRALLNRYTPEHPPVQRLQEAITALERETIPTMAGALMQELANREAVLRSDAASAAGELEQIPPRKIEEAGLERRVAIAEGLYRTLEQRVQEAELSAASAVADISILDRATAPRNPVRDEKPKLILMAMLGSLGLGILGAIVRERIDPTIRYPDQVHDLLGLTVLGAVPVLSQTRAGVSAAEASEATEAFRGIRLNVAHAHGAGPLLATISSPGPGDGKSFISSNLAVSFAELGRRTLLIDGDVRRGTLHNVMSVERTPGLTDFLEGAAALEDVVRETKYEHLTVIPSGRRTRQAPELIDSAAMRKLILEMRTRYDVILVDSAPLGAGVDPYVLSTLTGSMILVLRTGETDKSLTEAKLGMLERLPTRMLGAVLNGIRRSGGGYHYYQYYSYLPGYGAENEDEPVKQLTEV